MFDRKESEIQLRDQLASRFRQLRTNRLRLFKFRNIVTAETSITADEALTDIEILFVWRHFLEVFASFDIGGIISQKLERNVIERRLINLRKRLLFPFRILQRCKVCRNVCRLLVRQPEA